MFLYFLGGLDGSFCLYFGIKSDIELKEKNRLISGRKVMIIIKYLEGLFILSEVFLRYFCFGFFICRFY